MEKEKILSLEEVSISEDGILASVLKDIKFNRMNTKQVDAGYSDSYSDMYGDSGYSDIGYSDSYGPC